MKNKIIIIALAILVIIVIAGYALLRGIGQTTETTAPKTEANKQSGEPELAKPEIPKEIFSYQGQVQSVGDNQLTMLAKPAFNSVIQDTTLTIKIAETTKIEQLKIIPGSPILPKNGKPLPPTFKYADMSLSAIKIGDTIIVSSGVNIKNQTEFLAGRIEVIE